MIEVATSSGPASSPSAGAAARKGVGFSMAEITWEWVREIEEQL